MAVDQQDVRPLHILIPSDLHARLKALADSEERSMAWEARQAIEARLGKFEDRDSESQGAKA